MRPVRGAGECRGSPAALRPPFSPPGREPSRGASLAPSGQFTSCAAPGGREAPGELFRWGSPGPFRDDTKRGTRVSPLFGNTLPGGREQGTPQPRPKGRARPPFAKGGHPRFIVRSQQEGANLPPRASVRQRKEKLRASGNAPSFFMLHMWLSGQRPQASIGPTPPYQALRAFRAKPGMPPPASFLLTPSKGAFSFRRNRKEKGGFEAAGLHRHSRRAPGRGAHPVPREGKHLQNAPCRYCTAAFSASTRSVFSQETPRSSRPM